MKMISIRRFFVTPIPKTPDQIRFARLAKRLESPIERIFWITGYNRLSKLGKFTPQAQIGPYRADFTLTKIPNVPLLKVVIELDGQDYHSSPSQRDYDTQRDRYFLKAGWLPVHFIGSQVYGKCPECVREVVELVRGWQKLLK